MAFKLVSGTILTSITKNRIEDGITGMKKKFWVVRTLMGLMIGLGALGAGQTAQASPVYRRTKSTNIKAKTFYTTNRKSYTYKDNQNYQRWTFKKNHELKNYAGTRWTATRQTDITIKGKKERYYWVKNSRNNATGWIRGHYLKSVSAAENQVTNSKTARRARQIVTVVQNGASTATLQLWTKNTRSGIWQKKMTAASRIGPQGIGRSSEGSSRTPLGSYHLSFAFGKAARTKTAGMKYRQIKSTTYWIEDLNDAQYNTWQNRRWANAKNEHLIDYTRAAPNNQYQLAVVMDNYGQRNGSGFFIHVRNQWATAGCVSISLGNMQKLTRQLGTRAYVINVPKQAQIRNY